MTPDTDTVRRLAEMTDVAAFERIAAAVLRSSNPGLYGNLSHPGVQPGGKTVKAPFDNVGWVQSPEGTRFVCAAHTTEQNDLKGKWLHDPANVKPKSPGRRPTRPAGDLVKGMAEINKLREDDPGLFVTFALTANRETSFEVRAAVESYARAAGIALDVWPVSRIAHFLDTDPIGQIIRRNCLGTPVRLLSRDLLLEMGERSIRDHLPLAFEGSCIPRDGFRLGHGHTLVVGGSGMGKTTACATTLLAHIAKGVPAIVLRTEFLDSAATIEAALEAELRRQLPELESGAGGKALALCTQAEPLLVLLEDVNRANSPGVLLNKVLAWVLAPRSNQGAAPGWRAVCPIWPRSLETIEDQKRVFATVTLLRVDRYSSAEATRAVRLRAKALGVATDDHRAATVADRLGHDPLLIALHNFSSEGDATATIQAYVGERLGIVGNLAQRTRHEVLQALNQLLLCMLQHRALSPRWLDVKSWIADHDAIALLRHIAREGSVMRISDSDPTETLVFRHDRVMQFLLSGALAQVLNCEPIPDYVEDPFFAEILADAVMRVRLPPEQLAKLMDATPATAAHALRLASEVGSNYTAIAAQVLGEWLQRDAVKENAIANQRYVVATVLAETTDPHVRQLVAQFPPGDYPWHPLLAAAFRNGALSAGLTLLSMYEVGVTVAGKHSLLALVKGTYGGKLVAAVDTTLRRVDLNLPGWGSARVGALRLAGYLGDSSLAHAVRWCWDNDEGRDERLRSYLFAAARCCGDWPELTLGPVCDAWEAMPEEPDSVDGQPAERLAADHVAWEFRNYTPHNALAYLIKRANASNKIEWPILYMLRTVDHPDALEQLARYAATSGFMAARSLKSDWDRRYKESGRRMSSDSKARLLRIALDCAEPEDVRKQAFAFWETAIDDADLQVARQILPESLLHERALWARARRHDMSVIPEVLEKLPASPEYWLQIGRYVWSDALTEALRPLLERLAEQQDENSNLEYALAEALTHVEPICMVAMLSPLWTTLRTRSLMVQTVLLSTAPQAAALAREAFALSASPHALLKHFTLRATIDVRGKFGLSHPAQLDNLKPYLDVFPEDEIQQLWDACTARNWLDFRNQYLEPRVRNILDRRVYLPDDPLDTTDLDEALAGATSHLHRWIDQQSRRGYSRAKVTSGLLEWVTRHDEGKAVEIVAGILSDAATRRELEEFQVALGRRADESSSMKAARFNVYCRSLV